MADGCSGTAGSIGVFTVPTFVQVLPLTDRWSTKAVSLIELSFQLIVNRRLLPLPVMTQVIVSALSGAGDGHGPHHVHLFMAQDVAVPTYSQPKLTYWLVIGAVGLPAGSTLLKPIDASGGAIGLSRRMLLGTSNGLTGMIGRRATIVSSRRPADRVLPAELSLVGWDDDVVPRGAVEHLDVEQVEVDRVGVHPVVGDLPHLAAVSRRDRRDLDVAAGQVRRVDELRRRVDVRVRDEVL